MQLAGRPAVDSNVCTILSISRQGRLGIPRDFVIWRDGRSGIRPTWAEAKAQKGTEMLTCVDGMANMTLSCANQKMDGCNAPPCIYDCLSASPTFAGLPQFVGPHRVKHYHGGCEAAGSSVSMISHMPCIVAHPVGMPCCRWPCSRLWPCALYDCYTM